MNLTNLYELQLIDTQLNSITVEIASIEKKLKQNQQVLSATKCLEESQKVEESEQRTLRQIIEEIDQKKIKLSQSDAMLYSGKVQNPKELQDLQLEIQSLKKIIAKLEDKQLDQMIRLEEAQSQVEQANSTLNSISSQFETSKSQLAARRNVLTSDEAMLKKKREVVLQSISPDLLKHYETLQSRKNGLVIVLLENDACAACGTQLTPSERQEVRLTNVLFHCPTCGRILHIK
ncbi:MAG TPA: hypothetical protein DCK95_04685 [Anaerolineaceae bacterium]|uniref:Uncharacterized protein n=1 Tax=Anaerolinea thermophila TaxID=167964 RepID=A0A101FXP0_9CHLR|nr:MAG: hypothetical protein XD73_0936 [Anaerolinea thermophila]HAF61603.1 hypothetical protein [Anaerolineaceae bacterium]